MSQELETKTRRAGRLFALESALLIAYALATAVFGHMYDGLKPSPAWGWFWLGYGVQCAVRWAVVSRWWDRTRPGARLIFTLLFATASIVAGAQALWHVFPGYFISLAILWEFVVVWTVVQIGILAAMLVAIRRKRRAWVDLRIALVALAFIDAAIWPATMATLWRPPDPVECAACAVPGEVERMSPVATAADLSYPFAILPIPDRNLVAATFKMAGNLLLRPWNKPDANRLYLFDVSNPDAVRTRMIAMDGDMLPQNMAYVKSTDELLVAHTGSGKHAVESVRLRDFEGAYRSRRVPLDYEPHSLVVDPDEQWFSVVGMDAVGRLALWSLRDFGRFGERDVRVGAANIVGVWQSPGSARSYWAGIPFRLIEYDLATGSVRTTGVPFALGYLEADARRLYSTDVAFRGLYVVDLSTFTMERRVPLPFTPRALALMPGTGLIALGDWMNGDVWFYRLATWEPVGTPIRVGPYLRALAWDAASGELWAGSKCGVFRIRAERIRQIVGGP
ncbi:MAG: hypothetical protein IT350_19180 [Deltaproteobacteria bacterium]|nr:hypothetical protein [Deltaproteobacteria bacterium]